jgi:hypothetical protein
MRLNNPYRINARRKFQTNLAMGWLLGRAALGAKKVDLGGDPALLPGLESLGHQVAGRGWRLGNRLQALVKHMQLVGAARAGCHVIADFLRLLAFEVSVIDCS